LNKLRDEFIVFIALIAFIVLVVLIGFVAFLVALAFMRPIFINISPPLMGGD